jgi:dihydroxyacetone kinase-like predicted kinase
MTVLARGALTGARGNSGVIASQFLRGVAEALADTDAVLGPTLREALTRGATLSKAAMAEPVPGTMVTVFEAAATAARAETSDALQDVAASAATAAAAALDETPNQLAVLANAGVVDAGGRGVVVLFDALYAVVTGQPAALAAAQRATAERATRPSTNGQESSLYTSRESGSDAYAYEVMYLLEQVADSIDHATAGHASAGHGTAGHASAGHGTAGHASAGHGTAGHSIASHASAGHAMADQATADRDATGQAAGQDAVGHAAVGHAAGQNRAGQDPLARHNAATDGAATDGAASAGRDLAAGHDADLAAGQDAAPRNLAAGQDADPPAEQDAARQNPAAGQNAGTDRPVNAGRDRATAVAGVSAASDAADGDAGDFAIGDWPTAGVSASDAGDFASGGAGARDVAASRDVAGGLGTNRHAGTGHPVIDHLRDVLVGLGDSVSVVGDGAGLWTVHVHCNDIGAAIEAGVDAGRPRQIRVARFADAASPESSRFTRDRAVVVPSRSSEFADLLISEGVTVIQVDESVDEGHDESLAYRLLETITRTAAAHVTVLPADPGLVEAADEASIRAVAAGQDVVVVPCASPVQVLAAVAVHDPRRRAGDDVVAMAEAAAATRRGEVVLATEAAITWIGACEAGDVLGFADGEVMLIEPGPADVAALDRAACGVVKRMLAVGGELVTALVGADAPDELATELEDFLRREHPETELVVYQGGQHNAVLVLGVE